MIPSTVAGRRRVVSILVEKNSMAAKGGTEKAVNFTLLLPLNFTFVLRCCF